MFFALISTVMAAFSDIFWKKSLNFDIRSRAHELSSYIIPVSLVLYFCITWFQISSLESKVFLLTGIIILIDTIRLPIQQQFYREEKISVIMPYLNINKVLVIIASFFIFKDVSYTALCITILTIFIIAFGSIDLKTLKVPRCFWKILFTELLKTLWVLISGWLILSYSEVTFFNSYIILGLTTNILLVLLLQQWSDFKKVGKEYWKQRTLWSIWWFSWFLSLVVIKNLWLSISILLWFVWVGVTLLFSYIFLKDIPSKKDMSLTIIVTLLIWVWYYFK